MTRGVGNDFSQSNLINIAAVLFMWVTLPAFGAAAYVPAIVLERPLFIRCVVGSGCSKKHWFPCHVAACRTSSLIARPGAAAVHRAHDCVCCAAL